MALGSLVRGAQVFVYNCGNLVKGAWADELGHLVAAHDEDGGLGSYAILSSLSQVPVDIVLIGLVFHAGSELGNIQAEGISAGYLPLNASLPAPLLNIASWYFQNSPCSPAHSVPRAIKRDSGPRTA